MTNKLYSIKQKIIEYKYNKRPSNQKILMFHQVTNDHLMWIDKNVSITFNHFQEMIQNYLDNGFAFESVEKIEVNKSIKKKKVIYLTFDDGYEDTYTNVYPFLKKYNIPFIIFVTTSYINQGKYLKPNQIIEMFQSKLVLFGAHTVSHPCLRFLSYQEAEKEIVESKKSLENIINESINYFAYPYGSVYACSNKNIEIVKRCNFIMAFSTLKSPINERSIMDLYFVPRINVNDENFMKV